MSKIVQLYDDVACLPLTRNLIIYSIHFLYLLYVRFIRFCPYKVKSWLFKSPS